MSLSSAGVLLSVRRSFRSTLCARLLADLGHFFFAGDVDDRIRYIAQQLGMRTVLCVALRLPLDWVTRSLTLNTPLLLVYCRWSDDTDDWNFLEVGIDGVENNYKSIIANNTGKSAGVIVLTHEM